MRTTRDSSSGNFFSQLERHTLAGWLIAAPVLVGLLTAYCELHSAVFEHPTVALDVSVSWAFKVTAGWVIAGALLGIFSQRFSRLLVSSKYPRAVACGIAIAVAVFTLMSELLLSNPSRALPFLYARTPIHLVLSSLLVLAYAWQHARRRPPSTTAALPMPPASSAKSIQPESSSVASKSATLEVMTGTGKTTIEIAEIEYLEADGNYLVVHHCSGRTYLWRQTMSRAEEYLPATQFSRVHRSAIVNRRWIRERRAGDVLIVQSGQSIRIGRAYRDRTTALTSQASAQLTD